MQKISNKKQLIRIKEYVDKFLDSYGSNSFNVSLETIQNESFCMNEKQELYIIMNENGEEVGFFKLELNGKPHFYCGIRCSGFDYEIDIGIYKEYRGKSDDKKVTIKK